MNTPLRLDTTLLLRKKNLLAFSAGIDSSALFFLLLEHDIPFDIALVNYRTRTQSDREEAHAQALADRYGMQCHTIQAPHFENNFEKRARDFRYAFFEEMIDAHGYETLLTAHQLNDRLEWFLMRLSRGAGVRELIGMEPIEDRGRYTLIRPLLHTPRSQLLAYLHAHQYPYFVDESNGDTHFERNRFRAAFSEPLIAQFGEGIARSFAYLAEDKATLESLYETRIRHKDLRILHLHHPDALIPAADRTLKELGYLMSAAQRHEIARTSSLILGGQWAIESTPQSLWIAPARHATIPKAFKEQCRRLRIPPKIRPYLYAKGIDPTWIIELTNLKSSQLL